MLDTGSPSTGCTWRAREPTPAAGSPVAPAPTPHGGSSPTSRGVGEEGDVGRARGEPPTPSPFPCGSIRAMTEPPEFRIEKSELLLADTEYDEAPDDWSLPSYAGTVSFQKLPWLTDEAALAAAKPEVAIVGAPVDEGASNRPGARFGPRAIRQATYHGGDLWSIQLGTSVFDRIRCVDAGDAPILPSRLERALRVTHEKVWRVARTGAIPIVLGGDHSITYPSAAAVARAQHPRKVGIVHFDAHADTGLEVFGSLISHGTPMRNLIQEGWIAGRNFVQVGLRGYW